MVLEDESDNCVVAYFIEIAEQAELDISNLYAWMEERDPVAAVRWAQGIKKAILSLSNFPARCPQAPESAYFPCVVRHFLYGKSNRRYRIVFTVKETTVSILHVRHYRQDQIPLP